MSFLRVTRRLLSSKVSTAANAVPLALASGAVLVGGYYLADFLYKDKVQSLNIELANFLVRFWRTGSTHHGP